MTKNQLKGDAFVKNPNGFGTVRKLSGARRKPWAVYAPPAFLPGSLTKKRKLIGCYTTRAEAMLALSEWHNTPTSTYDVSNEEITLEQLRTEYVNIKYSSISKSTQATYNAAWRYFEEFYHAKVKNLRSSHFQAVVDSATLQGRSHSSLHKIKVFAVLLENYAMQNDIIDKNYAQFIILPKHSEKEKEYFNDIELKKLEKAADNGDECAQAIIIMCYTGWRLNEFLSLTPFSYDEKSKTLTGGMKTQAGKNRVVPVNLKIQPYLDNWLNKGGETIVCRENEVGRKGNKKTVLVPVSDKFFYKNWYYPTLEKLEIRRLTPHATRHTFISMLHKVGADKWDIQRLAGHSSDTVTNKVYTHVDLTQLKNAINLL